MKSSGVSYTLLLSLITPPPTGRCLHCIHMSAAGGCEESFPACVCVEMCRAIWVLSVNHVFVFFSELQTLNFQYKVSTEQKKKKTCRKTFFNCKQRQWCSYRWFNNCPERQGKKKKHAYYYLRNKETRWQRRVHKRIIMNTLRLAKRPRCNT